MKEGILMKDYLIRAIDETGMIRVFVASTTNMVEEARLAHNTSPTATAALGRSLTAATIMGSMMKNEQDRLTLRISGDGPIGNIVIVADNKGDVKGYVDRPGVDLPSREDGKLDVRGVVGTSGNVTVIMDLGLKDPYVGQAEIISGEIAEDIAAYYAISEQQPSAVSLGVLVDTDISVKAAGGYIIQLLPGVLEEDIDRIEKTLSSVEPVSALIDRGMTPEEILNHVLEGFKMEILSKEDIQYKCDCSREKIKNVLKSVGKIEIQNIIEEDGQAEIVCHFCNTKYQFNKEELENLIVDI